MKLAPILLNALISLQNLLKHWVESKPITTQELYRNGYATSPTWKERVDVIRKEVQQTLSEAGIKY